MVRIAPQPQTWPNMPCNSETYNEFIRRVGRRIVDEVCTAVNKDVAEAKLPGIEQAKRTTRHHHICSTNRVVEVTLSHGASEKEALQALRRRHPKFRAEYPLIKVYQHWWTHQKIAVFYADD